MRWIVFAAVFVPLAASAALDQPQVSSATGMQNFIGIVATSCAVGWVMHLIATVSGRYTPEGAAIFTTIACLAGGPLLWLILSRA